MTKKELVKEAGDFADRECCSTCHIKNLCSCKEKCECWVLVKRGAIYGYNKAMAEMQKSALSGLAEAMETWR